MPENQPTEPLERMNNNPSGKSRLKYFELCGKFWKMDYGQLKHWSNQVNAGETPEFGANLVY